MKITMFSNYLNHHQLPFCLEMQKILADDFKFVATTKVPNARIKLGYKNMNDQYDFVIKAYENEKEALNLGLESDVVIIGSAPVKYIRERLKQKKLIFRYSERIFKEGFKIKSFISTFLKKTIVERKNVYLLCSSAYSANDYNLSGAYKNKCFKWGYFPEVKEYENFGKLMSNKKKNKILWVARLIEVKHPEVVIELAKKMKKEKCNFEINMIGIGELRESIIQSIEENNLENEIKLLGSMTPEEVRNNMEQSSIFLFTSDRGEGWGAVLNESMNSGCAVVASHEIGSVPFLINNNENGLIYENGNLEDLFNKVKYLLDNPEICKKLGENAYLTMLNLWNAKIVAQRLVNVSKRLLNNENIDIYESGPCSKAIRLKDNWYRSTK